MKYLILKDRRRRLLYALYERRHNVLLSLIQNVSLVATVRAQAYRALLFLPRDSSITRIRNRCSLTGRSRAIYRRFGISRLRFRKLAWEGQLSGVKKASWLFNWNSIDFLMTNLSNKITSIYQGELSSRRTIVWKVPKGAEFKNFVAVLTLLRKEGIIRGFSLISYDKNADATTKNVKKKAQAGTETRLVVYLKYDSVGKSVVRSVSPVSTPGRRVFTSTTSLWQPQSTSGFFVLSTVYGIITDAEARRFNVGGEILFGIT